MKDELVEFSSLNLDLDSLLPHQNALNFSRSPFATLQKEISQKLQPIVGISSKVSEVHSSDGKAYGSYTLSPIPKKFKRSLKPFSKHFSRKKRFTLKSLATNGNPESYKSFDSHFKENGVNPDVLEERCVLMQIPSLASKSANPNSSNPSVTIYCSL